MAMIFCFKVNQSRPLSERSTYVKNHDYSNGEVMEKVTAYKCSFCKDDKRSIYLSRSGCRKHENRCWLNPARKSCATCINIITVIQEKEPYGQEWACSVRKNVKPFSTKIENCLYWEESGAIFSNEEPLFNRPVERNINKKG